MTAPEVRTPLARGANAEQTTGDAQIIGHAVNARKTFHTWRAKFAFRDYTLTRTDAADGAVRYYVSRFGLIQELADLDAVAAFARKAGAA